MAQLYESEAFVLNRVPIRVFIHELAGDNIYTALHWHRSIEFNLTTKGRIGYTIDGRKGIMNQGEWQVVNSGEIHSNRWIDKNDYFEGCTVQISKSFIDTWLGKNTRFFVPMDDGIYSKVSEYIEKFCKMKMCENKDELQGMRLLFDFMITLRDNCIETFDNNKREDKQTRAEETLKNVVNYIDEHYTEEISLTEVAAQFHYSPAHLSKYFKEHIGSNFHEYVQNVRLLNCVTEMRENKNISLTECSLKHGFPNQKSFIRVFRDTFGCTPSDWKKSHQMT